MSYSLAPININIDKWRVLVERVNELVEAANTIAISTNSNPTVGSATITGTFSANALYDSNSRVVTETRTISTGNGLSGGGNLSANLTISFNSNTIASLGKADSALQTADFTGKVGLKTKVDIADINTTGTANATSFLSGNGNWVQITNAGDMRANTYDPTGKNADAFNLANMYGKLTFTAPGADGAPLRFTAGAPITANTGDVWFDSNTLIVRTPTANVSLYHSDNLPIANTTTGINAASNVASLWSANTLAFAVGRFGVSNGAYTSQITSINNAIGVINGKIGDGPVGWSSQAYQNFARSINTIYQNTSNSAIFIAIATSSNTGILEISPNNTTYTTIGINGAGCAIIPNGHYYRVSNGTSVTLWVELRT